MLDLTPTPVTLWLGIFALISMAMLCSVSWRRSSHSSRTGILEILRFSITCLVVMLLWQAEWLTTIYPSTRPKIAVLWDASESMNTLDTADTASENVKNQTANIITRAEWTEKILASERWNSLQKNDKYLWETRSFSKKSEEILHGTDLSKPLEQLLEKEDNLRAIVLFSDGDFNLGQAPVGAAQKLRLRGIPVYTIPVGSESRLPDLELLQVTAPTYGIIGENVQIPFTIRSSLDRQVRTNIRLRDESGRERTKNIVLPPQTETSESILWRINHEGTNTLTLSLPVEKDEWVPENNSRPFTISGKPEQIRVLIVETLPRWEYRFLRNALSRDPGVELSCLLLHPELGPGGGRDYISEFPNSIEELSKFDVIVIGDIGMAEDQLTPQQCTMIRGLVESQASGVVFLPGKQGNQFTLLKSDLSDLIPVILDEKSPLGYIEAISTSLTLTREGRGSLLTMLGDSEEENSEIWQRLPGFFWHAPVIRAKGGAEVLAVHANRRGKFGPTPLMVTNAAGSGKVLFMGIDSAWRWRRGVEDLHHYRFWGQVARWMSYQRNMASGQRVRLFYTPERPSPGSNLSIRANAFDPNGAPLNEGVVSVDFTSPDGKSQRIELERIKSEWGSYSGRFPITASGTWKVSASVYGALDSPTETTILAENIDLEQLGQPSRPAVLKEISSITRARSILPDQLPSLISEISALPEPSPQEKRIPLGSHWATLSLLITLLGLFWVGRKWNGMF